MFSDHAEELRPAAVELTAFGSERQRSVQFSYGREPKPNITEINDLVIW
jgi:hypothetical protein